MLNADEPDKVEYILSVNAEDAIDVPMLTMQTAVWDRFSIAVYGSTRTSVNGWNVAARHSTGQILILNADDFFPPEHWDSLLLDKVEMGDAVFAIHVSTGCPDADWDRRLMALGIISRPLYQRWGYALYPGYESMESDVDMLEHALHDGVVIPAHDLVFEHRHPAFGKASDDEVYRKQNRPEAYALGKQVLERRRLDRFSK